MILRDALNEAAKKLKAAGVATPLLDAEILAAFTFGMERDDIFLKWDKTFTPDDLKHFNALIKRRGLREPVARITGVQEFWSLPFKVTPDTRIPRPDSETLVAAVLERAGKTAPVRILDLGTGTGCLLLALLSELPQASGVGADISKGTLECARENAKSLNLSGRARFIVFDWVNDIPLNEGLFDIVISNPPYIPTGDIAGLELEVAEFAPGAALDGGPDGLNHYRRIIAKAPGFFGDKGGQIYLEVGDGQAGAVKTLLKEAGFIALEADHDLAGKTRVVAAQFSGL
jgi:release factor glutamine methyltransferase